MKGLLSNDKKDFNCVGCLSMRLIHSDRLWHRASGSLVHSGKFLRLSSGASNMRTEQKAASSSGATPDEGELKASQLS